MTQANNLNRGRVSIPTPLSVPINHTPEGLAPVLLNKEFRALSLVRQAQVDHICLLLNARLDQGEQKYGMRLSTFMRGRNMGPAGFETPLADAYDEALDLLTYCERVRREAVILKRWDLSHRATKMMRAVQPFLFEMLEGSDERDCAAIEAHITRVEKRAPIMDFIQKALPRCTHADQYITNILNTLGEKHPLTVRDGKTILGFAQMTGVHGRGNWVLVSAMIPPSADSVFDLGTLHQYWVIEESTSFALPTNKGWQDTANDYFQEVQVFSGASRPLILEWEV